jgi:hypothetical protein
VLLFGDEAFYAGDKKHESILKMLITEEMITIEAKGVDAEVSGNCIHLMMASNDRGWCPPAWTTAASSSSTSATGPRTGANTSRRSSTS